MALGLERRDAGEADFAAFDQFHIFHVIDVVQFFDIIDHHAAVQSHAKLNVGRYFQKPTAKGNVLMSSFKTLR